MLQLSLRPWLCAPSLDCYFASPAPHLHLTCTWEHDINYITKPPTFVTRSSLFFNRWRRLAAMTPVLTPVTPPKAAIRRHGSELVGFDLCPWAEVVARQRGEVESKGPKGETSSLLNLFFFFFFFFLIFRQLYFFWYSPFTFSPIFSMQGSFFHNIFFQFVYLPLSSWYSSF